MNKEVSYLVIDNAATTSDIKKQFNDVFPFLKIEFFRELHIAGLGTSKNKIISSEIKLGEIQKIKRKGKVEIGNDIVVGKFEQQLKNEFGLYVQIFRKSGSIWLETSVTDNWTLGRQNEEGRMLEQHFKIDRENPEKYHST